MDSFFLFFFFPPIKDYTQELETGVVLRQDGELQSVATVKITQMLSASSVVGYGIKHLSRQL